MPLTWLLDVVAKFVVTRSLTAAMPAGLQRRLEQAASRWADALPSEAAVVPTAILPLIASGPEAEGVRPALTALRALIAEPRLPDASVWLAAIEEEWDAKRAAGADQPLFLLDRQAELSHLRRLSAALARVCAEDEKLYRHEAVAFFQEARGARIGKPSNAAEPDGEWIRRIDQANHLVSGGQRRAAIHLYREFEAEIAARTDIESRIRYRVYANLGATYMALGELDQARAHLTRARDYAADAFPLEHLAQLEFFAGSADTARAYALEAIRIAPDSTAAWGVLIQAGDPAGHPDSIPLTIREDPHILTSLGSRAAREGRYDESVDYFRGALRTGRREPQVLVLLAESLLLGRAHEAPFSALPAQVSREVVRLTSDAEAALRGTDDTELLSRAVAARSEAIKGGDPKQGLDDLQEAVKLAPHRAGSRLGLARTLLERGEAAKALFVLDEIAPDDKIQDVGSVRARALADLGRGSESIEAIRQAAELRDETPSPDGLLVELAQVALQLEETVLAEELLRHLERPGSLQEQVLRSRIAAAKGDFEEASSRYAAAIEMAEGEDRDSVAVEFARQTFQQGQFDRAAELFASAGAETREEAVQRMFARSLFASGEYARVLELIERLRGEEREQEPAWALDLVTRIALERDDLPAARDALVRLAGMPSPSKEHLVLLAHVHQRLGDTAPAEAVLDSLREAHALSGHDYARVAQIYSDLGQPAEALASGYRAVRRAPDDPEIKRVYIKFFLEREAAGDTFDMKVAAPETFVVLSEVGGSRTIEYYLVEGERHPGSHTEIDAHGTVGTRLLGRAVGDRLVFYEGTLAEGTFEIREIKSGYVHAFQQILTYFPTHHPEFTGIQAIRIDLTEPSSGIARILASADQTAAHAEDVLTQYRAHFWPLAFVGHLIGRDVTDMYAILTSGENLLFVDDGGMAWSEASGRNAEAGTLVLSVSALLTLQQIGRLALLPALQRRFLAPRSLVDEIRAKQRELSIEISRGGAKSIGRVNGRLQMAEVSPNQLAVMRTGLADILTAVEAVAEILPRPLAALGTDAEFRDAMGSSFDSCALSSPEAPIYADDLGLRLFAQGERGTSGVSTYHILEEAARRGLLSREEFLRSVGALLELRHAFVPISAELLYATFSEDAYEFSPRVLRAFERLAEDHATIESAVGVAVGLLRMLTLSPLGQAHVPATTTVLLEKLTRGRPVVSVLRRIDAAARSAFALLPLEYRRIRQRIDDFSRAGD